MLLISSSLGSRSTYTKYKHYPPYCSTPEEMDSRAIPPLKDSEIDSQLVQVTALIRHGARTPWSGAPDYQCWSGYWESKETGVWDCDLKTYMSRPAPTRDREKMDAGGVIEEEPDVLFEKNYDALTFIDSGTTGNILNGTCQEGQLLLRGYDQELRNGLHLRHAYFYDGDDALDIASKDRRMRLWDFTKESSVDEKVGSPVVGDPTKAMYQEPNLRYRSDDEQRTLMSGQILLRGIFEKDFLATNDDETASTIIRHHTADYSCDVMEINDYICPRVQDLWLDAYASDEYVQWLESSTEVKAVKAFAKEQLGLDAIPDSFMDCLMTTICTDRPLPDILNNYDGSLGSTPFDAFVEEGDVKAMFERMQNVLVKNFTFPYRFNNAAYAKLGMGPLWKEIMTYIGPIVDSTLTLQEGSSPLPRLHIISGHDTTLMPILATLGEEVWDGTDWSPYASMIQIEIHQIVKKLENSFPSGFAFRLVYNGQVLTSKMKGCPSDLCDSKILLDQILPFAKFEERDCTTRKNSPEGITSEMATATEHLLSEPGGVFVIVLTVLVSMVLGSAVTFFLLRRRGMPNGRVAYQKQTRSIIGDFSMSVMQDDENEVSIDSAVPTHHGTSTLT